MFTTRSPEIVKEVFFYAQMIAFSLKIMKIDKGGNKQMSRKTISLLTALFMLTTVFSNLVSYAAASDDASLKTDNGRYEVYPLPHNQTYQGTSFTITDEVNLVIEDAIDAPTTNFISSILAAKSIDVTRSESVVPDKTNILIGTRNSNGNVNAF